MINNVFCMTATASSMSALKVIRLVKVAWRSMNLLLIRQQSFHFEITCLLIDLTDHLTLLDKAQLVTKC